MVNGHGKKLNLSEALNIHIVLTSRLVAFYKAGKGNLEFICGGNLVSKTHVITAGSNIN